MRKAFYCMPGKSMDFWRQSEAAESGLRDEASILFSFTRK
jgi:hypothetical protein